MINDLAKKGLKGSVKLITETYGNFTETFRYDKEGFLIYYKKYGWTGSYREPDIESFCFRRNYSLDRKGNLLEDFYLSCYDDSLDEKRLYKYDKNGNKIKEKQLFYEENEKPRGFVTEFRYDEKGNMIESNKYSCEFRNPEKVYNSQLQQKIICKYDSKRNMIEEQINQYGGSGKNLLLSEKNLLRYDNYGNKIEEYLDTIFSSYIPSSEMDKIIETKKNGTYNDFYSAHFIYSCDDNGNIIESRQIVPEEYLKNVPSYRFEYDYDNVVNWIKKIEFQNEKHYKVTKREIEYY